MKSVYADTHLLHWRGMCSETKEKRTSPQCHPWFPFSTKEREGSRGRPALVSGDLYAFAPCHPKGFWKGPSSDALARRTRLNQQLTLIDDIPQIPPVSGERLLDLSTGTQLCKNWATTQTSHLPRSLLNQPRDVKSMLVTAGMLPQATAFSENSHCPPAYRLALWLAPYHPDVLAWPDHNAT